ncbi:MAG: L-histidine N(alpha)-methyltransferase [Candidatus Peribacteria bacterium]|jgi:uncharacterized SAM-dependent methyltransferase|nr:L-histidine N(alpha)-methyltransferase [Candidatus Peribacteria bacterium]
MTRESDIYINTSEVLSREEKDRILKSIFSAGRTPEAYFLYQGKGAELYEAVVNDPNYVYYQRGKNLITDNREALQKFIGKNVVDHGSGTGEKADLLLRNLHKPLHYIAQDYSYEMTELARDTVAEHNSFVNTGEGVIIKGKGSANNLTQGLEDATFLWLGGTIGNFSPEEDVKTLREMGNTSYLKGNYVIFDAFTAPSAEELEQELLPAYNSASQRAWLENGLEILGLQKEDFEVQIDYIKDPED